jgi:hypothetical protein
METFWVVWNENRGKPTFKHASEESAKKEAVKLARRHPGEQFHVLESTVTIKARGVEETKHLHPGPF